MTTGWFSIAVRPTGLPPAPRAVLAQLTPLARLALLGRRLAVGRGAAACLLLCSAALATWFILGTGHAPPGGGLLYFLLMPLCVYYAGRAVLRLCRCEADLTGNFATVFLTGAVSVALLLFAFELALPWSIRW